MKKRLLFIHIGATIGGAPFSLLETLKRLDQGRFQSLVLLPEEGPFSELLRKDGIRYQVCPLFIFYYCAQAITRFPLKGWMILLGNAFKNIVSLSRIIKEERPDVVIINASTIPLCGLVAKLMGKRVVWHVREVISTEKSRILKNIISANIRFSAERVVVTSEYSRQDMSNLGIRNVSVIYNGVDLKKFRDRNEFLDTNNNFGLNRNDKIVGFVGQIYHAKGWEVLVKAAFIAAQKVHDVKFVIAGIVPHPEEEEAFHQMVRDLGLSDHFIFLGQRFDVEKILPLMTCLVFPSVAPEVFGRSIIEAMSCGVPVIASRLGGPAEIVIDQVTGLLVNPDDPKALSEALISLLTDTQKARSMGQAGRKRAEEVYDIDKLMPKLIEIYETPEAV